MKQYKVLYLFHATGRTGRLRFILIVNKVMDNLFPIISSAVGARVSKPVASPAGESSTQSCIMSRIRSGFLASGLSACLLGGLAGGLSPALAAVIDSGGVELGSERPLKARDRDEALKIGGREAVKRIWASLNPGEAFPKMSDAQIDRAVRWTEFDQEKAYYPHYIATIRFGIDTDVLDRAAGRGGNTASVNKPPYSAASQSGSTPIDAGASSGGQVIEQPSGEAARQDQGMARPARGESSRYRTLPNTSPTYLLVVPVRSVKGSLVPFPANDEWVQAWRIATGNGVYSVMVLDGQGEEADIAVAQALTANPDAVAERLMTKFDAPAVAFVTLRTSSGGFEPGETAGVTVTYRRKGEESVLQALEVKVGDDAAGVVEATEEVVRGVAGGIAGTILEPGPVVVSSTSAGALPGVGGPVGQPVNQGLASALVPPMAVAGTVTASGTLSASSYPYSVEVVVPIQNLKDWVVTKAAIESLPASVDLRSLSKHEAKAVVRHAFPDKNSLVAGLRRAGVLR